MVGQGTLFSCDPVQYRFTPVGLLFTQGAEFVPCADPSWYFLATWDYGEYNFPAVRVSDGVLVPAPKLAGQYGLEPGEWYAINYRDLVRFVYSFAPPQTRVHLKTTPVVVIHSNSNLHHQTLWVFKDALYRSALVLPTGMLPSEKTFTRMLRDWTNNPDAFDETLKERAKLLANAVDGYAIHVKKGLVLMHEEWAYRGSVPWWKDEYTLFPEIGLFATTSPRLAKIATLLSRMC